MVVALALPVLIGATGLSVGIGYWYQQQESLQSAADAAALTAALNDTTLGQTTAAAKASAASSLAQSAADNATNSQFGFVPGTGGASVTLTATMSSSSTASTTTYTATTKIPRASFFTKGSRPLLGIGAGYQYASASAAVITTSSKSCTTTTCCVWALGSGDVNAIYATGGAKLLAPNCGIRSGSTACNSNNNDANSIAAEPSASITGATVISSGCIYVNTNGQAYVGGSNGNTSVNVSHAAAAVDPLAYMKTAPPWPTMPNTPAAPSGTTYTAGPGLGYNLYSGTYGDCIYMGTYSANCELYQGAYSGMNFGLASLVLNEGTSSGTTYISGGLIIQTNSFLRLNGSNYYVAGGMHLTNGGTASINASSFNLLGGGAITNGNISFASATDYFSGASTSSGTASTWGLTFNTPTISITGPVTYVKGGMQVNGGSTTTTLGQGIYLFSDYSGNTNTSCSIYYCTGEGAFSAEDGTINFTGGTYFFDGGLTVNNGSTVNFGPGIYYIRNGNLAFISGSHITATNATFVLEGNAGYVFDGGTTMTMSAPTTNCVTPANYPSSTYSLPNTSTSLPNGYAPYDGTNGEGICGILIYQARGDTTADSIIEGASSTVSGIIYAPSAALSVTGGASISSSTVNGVQQTLAFIQDTISLTGSGTINVNVAATDTDLNTGGTTTKTLLVN